jgi:cation diffusion facilitator CzcD-associated flavoprotein CzcO
LEKFDVCIIGGGAAGMMCAIFAARRGLSVMVSEKNEKLGKKLFITGKGRCNFTNACDFDTLYSNVITNPKFLYGAFHILYMYCLPFVSKRELKSSSISSQDLTAISSGKTALRPRRIIFVSFI